MDLISNAELIEIYLMAQAHVDAQFQYWLSVSFAVIVASFVAGDRLSLKIRMWLAGLYMLAVGVFVLKFLNGQIAIGMYVSEMNSREINSGESMISTYGVPMMVWFRRLLFLLGTITTLWFLQSNEKRIKE